MTLPALAWLDFSDRDRRRVLDVLNAIREEDTRDELGIGGVRDAFAELLFPGTNTIQTRARYFLFVPWLYLNRERLAERTVRKTPIAQLMRDQEIGLIDLLRKGGESEGVIGIDAGRNLQRLPSSIYWNGLARWGIRRFDLSTTEYHRWLGGLSQRQDGVWRDDDGEPVAGYSQPRWDPAIPNPPDNWPAAPISFTLTRAEAEYLRERVLASCLGSLLAHLVDRAEPVDKSVPYIWMHPRLGEFPPHLRALVEHARIASLVLHGAAWLYNLLLTEAQERTFVTKDYRDKIEEYRDKIGQWAAEVRQDAVAIQAWDLGDFWNLALRGNPRIGSKAQRFMNDWTMAVRTLESTSGLSAIADDPGACRLIVDREWELKGERSRFRDLRRLEVFQGPAGTRRLQYRWNPVVRDITNDILIGLAQPGDRDA